jgi:hypothetical protein
VDKTPGDRPYAVRGVHDIHATLEAKQRALTWHVVHQLIAHEAQQAQQGADPDGLAPLLCHLAAAARESCKAERTQSMSPNGVAAGDTPPVSEPPGVKHVAIQGISQREAGSSAMDIDSDGTAAASPPHADAANGTAEPAWAAAEQWGGGSMQSAAAADVHALLRAPGFQAQFRAKALGLLGGYLRGGRSIRTSAAGAATPGEPPPLTGGAAAAAAAAAGEQGMEAPRLMLGELLAWLRHRAMSHRVEASLARQVAAFNSELEKRLPSGPGAAAAGTREASDGAGGSGQGYGAALGSLSMHSVPSGAELVDVWQLAREGWPGAALVIVCQGAVRVEGSLAPHEHGPGAELLAGPGRSFGRREMDRIVECIT